MLNRCIEHGSGTVCEFDSPEFEAMFGHKALLYSADDIFGFWWCCRIKLLVLLEITLVDRMIFDQINVDHNRTFGSDSGKRSINKRICIWISVDHNIKQQLMLYRFHEAVHYLDMFKLGCVFFDQLADLLTRFRGSKAWCYYLLFEKSFLVAKWSKKISFAMLLLCHAGVPYNEGCQPWSYEIDAKKLVTSEKKMNGIIEEMQVVSRPELLPLRFSNTLRQPLAWEWKNSTLWSRGFMMNRSVQWG